MGTPTFLFAFLKDLCYIFLEMANVLSERNVKLDSKHRITVRKPVADHYRMEQYDDGRVVLYPMELVSLDTIKGMRKAVTLVKKGVAGKPVDMSQVHALLDEFTSDV